MGRAISKLKHPFRNFNVESRAHKVITDSKPKPAPKHARDVADLKRIKEEYSHIIEESSKKHEELDKHLKDIFVTSHNVPAGYPDPVRPLPQDRSQPEDYLFGHKEPDKIPLGKITLRNTLSFISQHQKEPLKYTTKSIAEEHKLPEDVVKNILKYFRVFEIYVPEGPVNTKARFAGPSNPKTFILREDGKMLPPSSANKQISERKKDKDET